MQYQLRGESKLCDCFDLRNAYLANSLQFLLKQTSIQLSYRAEYSLIPSSCYSMKEYSVLEVTKLNASMREEVFSYFQNEIQKEQKGLELFESGKKHCYLRDKKGNPLCTSCCVKEIARHRENLDLAAAILYKAQELFLEKLEWDLSFCKEYHHNPTAFYECGLIHFQRGDFENALLEISSYLNLSGHKIPDSYFQLGISYAEIGEYRSAVDALSKAIEKDPSNRAAYLERAASYFELGFYDEALSDYLVIRKEVPSSPLHFGKGLAIGAAKGCQESLNDLIPSALATFTGLGNMIWTVIKHPIETPLALVNSTKELVSSLQTVPFEKLAEALVPELYDLVTKWDEFDEHKRGSLAGYAFGKYGTDCLLTAGILKGIRGVKAYHELRKAEKLATLETLASSAVHKEALVQASTQWAEKRGEYFAKINLEMDKQGKHIINHTNYLEGRSEWTHPFPEKKIKELAGKGQKIRGQPGQPGYQERVDCGEIIGQYVNNKTFEKVPTTMAKIHYSKKGAHLVPERPKK